MNLLSYTEEDQDFAVGICIDITNVTDAQTDFCRSGAYNSTENEQPPPNRPSEAFIPSNQPDFVIIIVIQQRKLQQQQHLAAFVGLQF